MTEEGAVLPSHCLRDIFGPHPPCLCPSCQMQTCSIIIQTRLGFTVGASGKTVWGRGWRGDGPPTSSPEEQSWNSFWAATFPKDIVRYQGLSFVPYCIFLFVTMLFFFFSFSPASSRYKEAVVVCSQLEWMCTFSRPRFCETLSHRCSHSEPSRNHARLNNGALSACCNPGLLQSRGQPCCHRHKLI